MIVNIQAERLRPHPDNPRKNLGDLTELAASIKAHKILQNLTVVPIDPELYKRKIASKKAYPDDYYIVIGHRRDAAATLAEELDRPCVISDMDRKTQIATMMIENLQRQELSYLEQAQGFQMMLDMGDSVAEIAKQTGFSEGTINKRVGLLKNDLVKLQKALERGGTLENFAALDKIKDPELRNKVLDTIGTQNFNYELKKALDQEKEEARKEALLAEIQSFATGIEETDTKDKRQVQHISVLVKTDFQKPEDAGTREYFFVAGKYGVTLYAWPTENDKARDEKKAQEQKLAQERNAQLDKIARHAFELRVEFIKNLTTGLKKNGEALSVITEFAVQSMIFIGQRYRFDGGMFLEMLGIEFDENDEFDMEIISEPIAAFPERALLLAAYAGCGDSPRHKCHDWQGNYTESEYLDLLYSYLERLGYELSDEEIAYKDGTRELFEEQPEPTEQAAA